MMAEPDEYDPTDPNQVQAREKKSKAKQVRINDGFAILLSNRNGRAWLWDFIGQLGPFRTPFTDDPYMTAHQTGRQSVALELMAKLTTPENMGFFVKMMEEANGR